MSRRRRRSRLQGLPRSVSPIVRQGTFRTRPQARCVKPRRRRHVRKQDPKSLIFDPDTCERACEVFEFVCDRFEFRFFAF